MPHRPLSLLNFVARPTGGLEILSFYPAFIVFVARPTGGLETQRSQRRFDDQVARPTGGLENTVQTKITWLSLLPAPQAA